MKFTKIKIMKNSIFRINYRYGYGYGYGPQKLCPKLASQGFGLLEVIIAGGIMSFIALALLSFMDNLGKSQKNIQNQAEFTQLMSEILPPLGTNVLCSQGLLGVTVVAGVPTGGISVPVNVGTATAPAFSNTDPFFANGMNLKNPDGSLLVPGLNPPKVDIRHRLVIKRFGFIPGSLSVINPNLPATYSARLQLLVGKVEAPNSPSYGGSDFRERQFGVRLTTDLTGTKFQSCVGGLAASPLTCLPGQLVAGTDALTGDTICSPNPPCQDGEAIVFNGTDWDCTAVNSNPSTFEGATVIMCNGECG